MQYILYHGTNFEFSVFSEIAQNDDLGFFFSDDIDDARGYGNRVISCAVRLNNPYTVNSSEIYVGINEIPRSNERISEYTQGVQVMADNIMYDHGFAYV